MIMIGEANWKN